MILGDPPLIFIDSHTHTYRNPHVYWVPSPEIIWFPNENGSNHHMTSLISKQTLKHVIVFLKCLSDNDPIHDPAHEFPFHDVGYICQSMEITLCGLVTSVVLMGRLADTVILPPLETLGFRDQWVVCLMIAHKFCEEIPRHALNNWLVHLDNCYMKLPELLSLEVSTLQALDFKILPTHEEFCKVTDGLDAVELQTRIGKPLRTTYGESMSSKQYYGKRTDADNGKTYRVVECSRHVNLSRIFTEREWRDELKITMSQGWVHLFTSILNTKLMVFVRDTPNENIQDYEFIFKSSEKCLSTGAP